MDARFDRNIRFFGAEGQQRLRQTTVAIVGVGGLGTHVAQQLAHLGIGRLVLIDDEELDETNKNRYVGSYADDPTKGFMKVDIGIRMARLIDPHVQIDRMPVSLLTRAALSRLESVDYVMGCVDNDGARLVLTEHCLAFRRVYIDLASDIDTKSGTYGGRVFVAQQGDGCLVCLDQLDLMQAREDLENTEQRKAREEIYGINRSDLDRAGPSVISINGAVASMGVTELLVVITGIRKANRLLTYRAHIGGVTVSKDHPPGNCYYCREIFGIGSEAETDRFAQNL
jgi:molybdopterin/thiamine biosynthesis adenylyltransferase